MMKQKEATDFVYVDVTNPGQFFACCGLLEMADRLWSGAEGWFEDDRFNLRPTEQKEEKEHSLETLIKAIGEAELVQLDEEDDKTSPIKISSPFSICLDWWKDSRAGGEKFKTWAGQQKVSSIAESMKQKCKLSLKNDIEHCLSCRIASEALPFNYDSNLGNIGSAVDIGFSFDPLKSTATMKKSLTPKISPFLEYFAFIGLQRFRPKQIKKENMFDYYTWNTPLSPVLASIVACGFLNIYDHIGYSFRLLYRTKYLKNFLPAIPITKGDE